MSRLAKAIVLSLGVFVISACSARAAEVADNLYPPAEQRQPSPGDVTYHINPAAGDDANSGRTPKLAWRTFRRINQLRLSSGGRVEIIAPGAFDQTLALAGAGTMAEPVAVRSAPGRYDFYPDRAYREAYQISNTNDDPEGCKAVGILLAGARHFRISGPGATCVYRGKMIEVCIDQSEDVTLLDASGKEISSAFYVSIRKQRRDQGDTDPRLK